MGAKVWLRQVDTKREFEADGAARCAVAPPSADPSVCKGAEVTRDDGATVQLQAESGKWKLDVIELRQGRVGEMLFARVDSPLGSLFWPMCEVLSGPTKPKQSF